MGLQSHFEPKLFWAWLTHCICPSDAPDAMDLWRHYHAWTNWEETHPLHGDSLQTTSTPTEISWKAPSGGTERGQAPGAESVQARQCINPPVLGERQQRQKDPSPSLPYTNYCVLGHGHLTVMTPPCHRTPNYPLPCSSVLCWFSPVSSGLSGQPRRASGGC